MIDKSFDLQTRNQSKRFLKKEIFLQTSLNFYLNWREGNNSALNSDTSLKWFKSIKSNPKNLNFQKDSIRDTQNTLKNRNFISIQNNKSFDNFSSKQKSYVFTFNRSHSYWLFTLFALIGITDSERTKPYFSTLNQFALIDKNSSQNEKLGSNLVFFKTNEIEIPVKLTNQNSVALATRSLVKNQTQISESSSLPVSHLHLDLKRRILDQFIQNSIWTVEWWKFPCDLESSSTKKTLNSLHFFDLKLKKAQIFDQKFQGINTNVKNERMKKGTRLTKLTNSVLLPLKVAPFKNALNLRNQQFKITTNDVNKIEKANFSSVTKELNLEVLQKISLQPIQSYFNSSLLYDSLFFDLNISSTSQNEKFLNSESLLYYLKELRQSEFWKNYFQAYLQNNLTKHTLDLTFPLVAKDQHEKLVLTSNLLEKIFFQMTPTVHTSNSTITTNQTTNSPQIHFENSLRTNFLSQIFKSFENSELLNPKKMNETKKENEVFFLNSLLMENTNLEFRNQSNKLKELQNSTFHGKNEPDQTLLTQVFIKKDQALSISKLDKILINDVIKLKTPILESTKQSNFISLNNQKETVFTEKNFKQSNIFTSNSLVNMKFDAKSFSINGMVPYFSESKVHVASEFSKNRNIDSHKIGLNLNLKGKIDNLVWVRTKLLNLLKKNWKINDTKVNQENSTLIFKQNRTIRSSTKKMRKIEKILRSYLSIKKISMEGSHAMDILKDKPQVSRTSFQIWNKHLVLKKNSKKKKFHLNLNNLENLKTKLIQNFRTHSSLKEPTPELKRTKNQNDFLLVHEKTLTPQNLLVKKGLIFIRKSTKENISNFNRLDKIKTQQKQRRRKKQRRENRRRKKRKRFYPRPLWLRFSLYRKFLAKRYCKPVYSTLPFEQLVKRVKEETFSTSNNILKTTQTVENFRQKIYRTNRQFSSPMKEKNIFKTQKFSGSNSVLPIFGENRYFYIPKFVIADFQRSLLKSYWLKANLKPYLTRIQNSLDQINSNEKDLNFLTSFKSLFFSFFKLEALLMNSGIQFNPNTISAGNFDNSLYPNVEYMETGHTNLKSLNQTDLLFMNPSLTTKLVNLSEYNQILYKRILNFIKNIKLNLNINGNVRPHPFHEGRSKQEKIEIHNVWNRLNQFLNFELFSSSLESSGLLTNLRTLWSINKTNLFAFKEQNDTQKIWNFSKYRDQKKSNKTRLLLTKFHRFLSFQSQKEQAIELSKLTNVVKKSKVLFNKMDKTLSNNFATSLKSEQKSMMESLTATKSYRLKTPKRSLYFWWNSSQLNVKNFTLNSRLKQQNNFGKNFTSEFLIFNKKTGDQKTQSVFWKLEKDMLLKSCLLMVHICSLFALLQISQIRSFIKFSFLVSIKFVTAYFMIFSLAINRFVNLKTESKFLSSFVNQSTGKFKEIPESTLNSEIFDSISNTELDWNQISYKKKSFISSMFELKEKNETKFKEINSFECNKLREQFELVKSTKGNDPLKLLVKLPGNVTKTQQVVNVNTNSTVLNILFSQSQLFLIRVTKLSILSSYQLQKFVYSIFSKFLEMIEGFLAFIYQFLEKPAEFMIDWIAQLFLIEWSSSLRMVIPDLLENNMWKTFFKLSRNFSIFGLTGILIQRRFLSLTENFASLLTEADTDLIIRQKKGQVFWEIWSEILIKAVDKYNMNLSSLTTLKDEQDRLLQNLINDSNWNWSTSSLQTLIPFLEIQHRNQIQTWNLPKHQKLYPAPVISHQILETFQKDDQKTQSVFLDSLTKKKNWTSFIPGIFQNSNLTNQTLQLTQSTQFTEKQSNSWSTYQSITLQARESDLFIEYNPPRTFQNTRIFKHAGALQPNMGGIVCEIYAGIFSRKVSKNTLVIGPAGREKTWLIQALAGETELKLMVDNASRYAIVQRGVAIGMKLLRDVFEGLALNAPCIFLIEDIHVIGEKRSLLISEDQITSADNLLGTEREEIHEKNQMISQVTRHMIAHYKKPYKGDFSMTIAANRLNFQLFLGVSPPITRQSNLTVENPLPYKDLPGFESDLTSQSGKNQRFSSTTDWKLDGQSHSFTSFLEIPKQQKFSPSTTSPLSLLMLREQKKLKPKKNVKELPWFGLPADQANLMPKASYSIRVKVAMLADLAISNLSVKLDMITELLVIIDSVRSNRGFMIFATTHLPYKLDPALRRPGRLDETLNLGLIPNFKDRLEILKLSIGDVNPLTSQNFDIVRENQFFDSNFVSKLMFGTQTNRMSRTFNCFDYSIEFKSLTQIEIQTLLTKTKRLLHHSNMNLISFNQNQEQITQQNNAPAFDSQVEKFLTFEITKLFSSNLNSVSNNGLHSNKNFLAICTNENLLNEAFAYLNSGLLNLNAKIYAKTSQVVFEMQCEKNVESYTVKWWNTHLERSENFASLFEILYSTENQSDSGKSKNVIFQRISSLLARKVGEYLIFSNSKISSEFAKTNLSQKSTNFTNMTIFGSEISGLKRLSPLTLLTIEDKKTGQLSPYSLIVSLLQKRANFSQNMAIGEFLSFQDKTPFKEVPGPTLTSILNPLQKYENYKRTESDFQMKPFLSIQEKIQLHQQQRFLKNLYQKPIQQIFQTLGLSSTPSSVTASEFKSGQIGMNLKASGFHNSIRELGYHDLILSKPTSVNVYYRNRILGRHRYYYLNQWWTGQLPEHNAEMTFSSDVDWRSKFIEKKTSTTKTQNSNPTKSIDFNSPNQNFSAEDIQIDFPDPDQYYNPRSRRWILNSGYWATWNNLSTSMMLNFSSYSLIQNFQKTYNYLSEQREILDYFSYLFLKNGNLKEVDLIWLRNNSLMLKNEVF